MTQPSPARRETLDAHSASGNVPPGRVVVEGLDDPRDLEGLFAHRHRSEVRFADTDAMGHVNNAVYLTYVEAARVAWWRDVTGEPIQREPERSQGLILAEAEVAYRAPVFHGDTITVETRPTRIGRSSLTMEHRLTARAGDEAARLVATSRCVVVRYDYTTERPVPFPGELVAAIETAAGKRLRAESSRP
jgi:acyl-CoA thioester hydrolase